MAVNETFTSNLLQSICILMWQTEIGFMLNLCYVMQKYTYCDQANGTAKS